MFGARGTTILLLTVALAAFTFGCSDDGGGGAAGSGGTAGSGGDGGMGGMSGIEANFATSLHNTREGKHFWYSADQNGMEVLTGVDYNEFACKDCHDGAANPDWTEPTCGDCHDDGDKHLQSETCLGCHGRQKAEIGMVQGMDFHSLATPAFVCADCHKSNDVHGNGTEYDTMLRPGAISTRCTDCHVDGGSAPLPPEDSYHGAQHGALDCALCHTETVISCINCHVEEDLDFGEKCQTGPVFNWKFVMKWDKEGDGNEVYHPATLMTLKYNCDRDADPGNCPDAATDPKKSFAVFAPFYAHTVTQQAIDNITSSGMAFGQDGCAYCHGADNCDTILNAGNGNPKQKLIEWTGTGLTNPISGLIPLPADYADRFEVDYAEFEAGPGTHCKDPDNPNTPKPLVFYETGPDMWQTGEDTTAPNTAEVGHPLNANEFAKFCPEP